MMLSPSSPMSITTQFFLIGIVLFFLTISFVNNVYWWYPGNSTCLFNHIFMYHFFNFLILKVQALVVMVVLICILAQTLLMLHPHKYPFLNRKWLFPSLKLFSPFNLTFFFQRPSIICHTNVTPWNPPALIIIMQFVQLSPSCDRLCLCFKNSQRNPCASSLSL